MIGLLLQWLVEKWSREIIMIMGDELPCVQMCHFNTHIVMGRLFGTGPLSYYMLSAVSSNM